MNSLTSEAVGPVCAAWAGVASVRIPERIGGDRGVIATQWRSPSPAPRGALPDLQDPVIRRLPVFALAIACALMEQAAKGV